jgi:hypothetical protein
MQKEKKATKYMNKNQLIDSYIEGDIELVDFIEHMETKMKDKKSGKNRNYNGAGMKRLSEMFMQAKRPLQNEEDEKLAEIPALNRTALVTL